jgi:uncharacterized protein
MSELHASLVELQKLDDEIRAAESRLEEFGPRLRSLDDPVAALEAERQATAERLEKLRHDARKLEHGATQKKERLRMYQERIQKSRKLSDESAARAELDLIRRAIVADEQESTELATQVTRTDLKLDDLARQIERKRTELKPQHEEIEAERSKAESELQLLRDRRAAMAATVATPALRVYDRIRSGRNRRGIAPLTDEGACGQCYNVLPVQEQEIVRRGQELHRCEQCGIILYAP